MKRKTGKIFLQKTKDTEVLHQHGVNPVFIYRCEKLRQHPGQLIFLEKRIHREVQLSSVKMTIIDSVEKITGLRILRKCARAEHTSARVNSICARVDSRAYALHASARSQKFNPAAIFSAPGRAS